MTETLRMTIRCRPGFGAAMFVVTLVFALAGRLGIASEKANEVAANTLVRLFVVVEPEN